MSDIICLPAHGRIQCSICYQPQAYSFDRTRSEEEGWRITNNPMAWGGSKPEVIVLGFSKGPTQAGALSSSPHETIAYKGGRTAVAKILHHIGLLERADARTVDSLIASPDGPIHFASLIRCTVERWDDKEGAWRGTGGGMLDRFVATDFGRRISENCGTRFLSTLPEPTRLVVMLGLGSKLNYVRACRALYERVRPGPWHTLNEVAYTDGQITVVHTEHFKSQGSLLPDWLSEEAHDRGRLGLLAREAVSEARIAVNSAILARREQINIPSELTLRTNSARQSSNESNAEKRLRENATGSRSGTPGLQQGHRISLTDGAIRNGNLSLNSVRKLIPTGGIGGANKSEIGQTFKVRFDPGEVHETDIAGDKMLLRCRGAVREFFRRVGARNGDFVRIYAEAPRTLVVSYERR